uniref:Uncharacterized protein n=1 Tax=Anguilla anguilla TaxID=7936 RepID=A0A0E9XL04_ANGAN
MQRVFHRSLCPGKPQSQNQGVQEH